MKSYEQRIRALDEHMLWAFWAAHPEQIPASIRRISENMRALFAAMPTASQFVARLRTSDSIR